MGRTSKPIETIKAEGRTHLTKAQIAQRERGEQEWRTGWAVKCTEEVRRDPVALAQFERITPYLTAMGVNDEIFGNQIRRYCTTTSKLVETWKRADEHRKKAEEHAGDKWGAGFERLADRCDRQALAICRELREFEKEYGMTAMSSPRMKPQACERGQNPFEEILGL